jgi:hypothetical protein
MEYGHIRLLKFNDVKTSLIKGKLSMNIILPDDIFIKIVYCNQPWWLPTLDLIVSLIPSPMPKENIHPQLRIGFFDQHGSTSDKYMIACWI